MNRVLRRSRLRSAIALIAFLVGAEIVPRRRAEREYAEIVTDRRRAEREFEEIFNVPRSREKFERATRGEPVTRFENRNIRADGTLLWLEWSARPLPEERIVYAAAPT